MSTYTSSSINGARNGTILEVLNLVAKIEKHPIDHEALDEAMGWLLNYTAVGLPAISSVAFSIAYHPTETFSVEWERSSYKTLRSMIGFILWYFTENNNGNMQLELDQMNGKDPVVAAEFHVRASLCQAFTRFVISRTSFVIYVVLHTAVLSFCWCIVFWGIAIRSRLPRITAFAAVDLGAKLRRVGDADGWPLEHVAMTDDEQRILLALKEERATSRCSM